MSRFGDWYWQRKDRCSPQSSWLSHCQNYLLVMPSWGLKKRFIDFGFNKEICLILDKEMEDWEGILYKEKQQKTCPMTYNE